MPGKLSRKYRIEHWVHSNMTSQGRTPFTFRTTGAEVILFLLPSGQTTAGFIASTNLTAAALTEAEMAAENVLTNVLDFLSYETKVYGLVERRVRSQVEGNGSIRQCALYWAVKHTSAVPLVENQAAEVQRLLASNPPRDLQRALYWRRWSSSARTVPEAFLYIWMVLERLAGEEERVAICRTCQEQVTCRTHGPHKYVSVTRESINALLDRHDASLSKHLLRLRNPLVHGSLEYNSEERRIMLEALPALRCVVDDELRIRLETHEALHLHSTTTTRLIHAHRQYQTQSPDEPFPPDCPTPEEAQCLPGGQNPKHITLLQRPPDW